MTLPILTICLKNPPDSHNTSNTVPSAPPAPNNMSVRERISMAHLQETLGLLIEGDEADDEEVIVLNEGNRTSSSSLQEINPFEPPVVHLFRTNSEGHRA